LIRTLKQIDYVGEDCKIEIAEVRPKKQIHILEKTQIGHLL
jgi:hypothetical protein